MKTYICYEWVIDNEGGFGFAARAVYPDVVSNIVHCHGYVGRILFEFDTYDELFKELLRIEIQNEKLCRSTLDSEWEPDKPCIDRCTMLAVNAANTAWSFVEEYEESRCTVEAK